MGRLWKKAQNADFIIRATPEATDVTALEKTQVEVVSTSFPENKPLVVTDFEKTTVEKGALPSQIVTLEPEEIVQIKKEFSVSTKPAAHEVKVEGRSEKAEKKDSQGSGGEKGGEGAKEGKGGEEHEDIAQVNVSAGPRDGDSGQKAGGHGDDSNHHREHGQRSRIELDFHGLPPMGQAYMRPSDERVC